MILDLSLSIIITFILLFILQKKSMRQRLGIIIILYSLSLPQIKTKENQQFSPIEFLKAYRYDGTLIKDIKEIISKEFDKLSLIKSIINLSSQITIRIQKTIQFHPSFQLIKHFQDFWILLLSFFIIIHSSIMFLFGFFFPALFTLFIAFALYFLFFFSHSSEIQLLFGFFLMFSSFVWSCFWVINDFFQNRKKEKK